MNALNRFWIVGLCAAGAGIAALPLLARAQGPSVAKDGRLFEMRTYYAAPGKFEAMHSRFRDHTNGLFKKHGMQIIGYWVPTDKAKGAENTLIYLLAFPNAAAKDRSWQGFINDPDWKKAYAESEANGKLVEKIESITMNATDYSPMK